MYTESVDRINGQMEVHTFCKNWLIMKEDRVTVTLTFMSC